jgi:glycosyltransferase involved in cell wall biosynthesis
MPDAAGVFELPAAADLRQIATFILDATPLLDTSWTGIPVVCAHMARQLLAAGHDLRFSVGKQLLPNDAVLDALERNSGLFLHHEMVTGQLDMPPLTWPRDRVGVGLSASVKRVRRVFDVECSVVHDISTILQPQYHTPENIVWHTEHIMDDIASNDVTVCISQATLDDLVLYLGADPARLVLAYNGVEWPWWFPIKAATDLASGVEPYVAVLATREPRKNLSLVMEMLAAWPELLRDTRFVFIGKAGWLTGESDVPPALAGALAEGRIVEAGFISEYRKYVLLRGAAATIFPSLFEGYGLPVVESLSVATPCVASFSSSIPEVGGDLCHYFDPCSAADLHRSLAAALASGQKGNPTFEAACAAWVARFSWQAGSATMLRALTPSVWAAWEKERKDVLF